MKKIYIYSGIPGSGKSTISARRHPDATVVSADDFFTDKDGVYRFDSSKIAQAHGACLREFVNCIQDRENEIVVDNTNCSGIEISPYASLGVAYDYDVEIITVTCDPAKAAARNIHGVPHHVVMGMHRRLTHRDLPTWWKVAYIKNDD